MSALFTFFDNQTTNATSPIYDIEDGGIRGIKATGVFDSSTVTIEMDMADGLWAPIKSYQFTDEDFKGMKSLKTGFRIRMVLTNAGASTSVTVKLL